MRNGFHVGHWTVHPDLNVVSENGTATHLEPKVMDVLVCLAETNGEVVNKEILIRKVWPDTFVSDDVLKRSISELRRVFKDDARDARIIETIPKRGYRLLIPVEPLTRSAAQTAPAREKLVTPPVPPIPRPRRALAAHHPCDCRQWSMAFSVQCRWSSRSTAGHEHPCDSFTSRVTHAKPFRGFQAGVSR